MKYRKMMGQFLRFQDCRLELVYLWALEGKVEIL